jgi:hypothetical protein
LWTWRFLSSVWIGTAQKIIRAPVGNQRRRGLVVWRVVGVAGGVVGWCVADM